MATLTPKLTLTSSDVTTDTLSFSIEDALDTAEPTVNIARQSIATGSAQAVIASNSAFSHVFLHVASGTNASDWVQIKLGGDAKMKMRVGEFAFFPLYTSQAITAEAQGGACILEYGFWTNS